MQFERLTFDGVNDLYQTPYGAHTLTDYTELLALRKKIVPIVQKEALWVDAIHAELDARNERCIDEYGCSMF